MTLSGQLEVTGAAEQPRGSVKPVDQFHKVENLPAETGRDLAHSVDVEAQARKDDAAHEENIALANEYWSGRAKAKD